MKLSTAILKGSKMVRAYRGGLFFNKGRCCAIGTALVAHFGDYRTASANRYARAKGDGTLGTTARIFNVPASVAQEASNRFESGQSRSKVATWLKASGY